MTVESVTKETVKGRAIVELQQLRSMIVTGGAAGADLTATGIAEDDTIVSVIMFAAGVPSDVTSEASITAASVIQLSTSNSTGNKLLVLYFAKPTN